MKKIFLASVLAASLCGCATNPEQFSNSVNNAVTNTETAAVTTVTIGTELIKAALALYQPVRDIIQMIAN